jgi:hypothetical protein
VGGGTAGCGAVSRALAAITQRGARDPTRRVRCGCSALDRRSDQTGAARRSV